MALLDRILSEEPTVGFVVINTEPMVTVYVGSIRTVISVDQARRLAADLTARATEAEHVAWVENDDD